MGYFQFSVLYWKRFMNRYSQGTYTMSWLSKLSIVYIAYFVMFEKSALNCWLKLKSEHKLFVGLRRNLLFSLINISYTTSNISDILRYKLNLKENIQQLLLIYLIRVYFNTNHRLLSQNLKGLLKLKIIDTDKKLQILSY